MTLNHYNILIVDDNPTFAKTLGMLIRTILGAKLTRLDLAINGKDGVEMAFQDEKYDFVFMDINMPEMDGIAATKLINRELYRQTKVVAISFNKDIETVSQMLYSGAESFIDKDNLTIETLENVFEI